jgi:integrase
MARPKKPTYEYVEKLQRYRKRIKDADGTYVAIYGKTPDELTEKLAEAQEQIDNAIINRNHPTLGSYAEKWLELHSTHIGHGTLQNYKYIIKTYIKAPLGTRRLGDITSDDVKTAMLTASGKSASVYGTAVMLYKQIFDAAVENGYILQSPCQNLKMGGIPSKGRQALPKEQVIVLLDAIRSERVYPFVMIGLYSGLRREEILGLQWNCVELSGEAPCIRVRKALRWEHNRPVVTEKLKSPAAKRDIPIPAQLVECLTTAKESSNSEYVIADCNGQPLTETQFRHLWHAVVCRTTMERKYTKYKDGKKIVYTISPVKGEKANHRKYRYTIDFEVTPHILRHTYVTNLLLAGVDVKTVQYLAGHEKAKITLDIYAHLTYNKPIDLAGKINSAFSG